MSDAQQADADIIEEFEERIAIMTIDGKCRESIAVQHAYGEQRKKKGSGKIPERVKRRMREVMG